MSCSARVEIRKDLDLTDINDLVKYFQRLLLEKAKKDKDSLKSNRPHCTTLATGGDYRDGRGYS